LDGGVAAQSELVRPRRTSWRRSDAFDVAAVLGTALLVLVAGVVGWQLNLDEVSIHAGAAPLQGHWAARFGVGSVLAPLLAVVVVTIGVRWARRATWVTLWPATWGVAAAWGLAVAWVDPWTRGVTDPLLSRYDYLVAVPRINTLADLTTRFTDFIAVDSAQPWPTHVSSHPPGALLPFVLLDRIGLGGVGPAAALIVLVGASTAVALLVAARALTGLDSARHLAPFVMLGPGAIWVVMSADAAFMATVAWAVALASVAATSTGRRADLAALGAGLVAGVALYQSYGMVLALLIVGVVPLVHRRWRACVLVAAGVGVVVAAVTLAGFWWLDGYGEVVDRYYAGLGGVRPHSYWIWANLAAFALAVGPAAVVGVRRAVAGRSWAVASVSLTALGCVLVATVGGLSRGEVERIWLPFGAWVLFAAVTIPADRVRFWLGAQAAVVLGVAHAVFTPW
jgi:hypothetical protein